MLDQDEPGPPCAGPLGPAYVCGGDTFSRAQPGPGFQQERKREGREGEPSPGQEGPAAVMGAGM